MLVESAGSSRGLIQEHIALLHALSLASRLSSALGNRTRNAAQSPHPLRLALRQMRAHTHAHTTDITIRTPHHSSLPFSLDSHGPAPKWIKQNIYAANILEAGVNQELERLDVVKLT